VIAGYFELPNKLQQVYFSYWFNVNKIKNAPVIIGNPGGPGVTSQAIALNFGGPLIYDLKKKEMQNYPKKSLLTMADLFLIDLPYGSGFSLTKAYDKTESQLLIDGSTFFDSMENFELFINNGID